MEENVQQEKKNFWNLHLMCTLTALIPDNDCYFFFVAACRTAINDLSPNLKSKSSIPKKNIRGSYVQNLCLWW